MSSTAAPTAVRPRRTSGAVTSIRALATDPISCPAEVEAWLAEVTPILAALRLTPTAPSSGQQRWLVQAADDAHRALDLLEAECADAEAHGEPTDGFEWLHTRVASTLQSCRSLLAHQPSAA